MLDFMSRLCYGQLAVLKLLRRRTGDLSDCWASFKEGLQFLVSDAMQPDMVLPGELTEQLIPACNCTRLPSAPAPEGGCSVPTWATGALSHAAATKQKSNHCSEAPTRGRRITGRTTAPSCLWSCLYKKPTKQTKMKKSPTNQTKTK